MQRNIPFHCLQTLFQQLFKEVVDLNGIESFKEKKQNFKKNYQTICSTIDNYLTQFESREKIAEIEKNIQFISEFSLDFQTFFLRYWLHFKGFLFSFGKAINDPETSCGIGKFWSLISSFIAMHTYINLKLQDLVHVYQISLGNPDNCLWDCVVSSIELNISNLYNGCNSTNSLNQELEMMIKPKNQSKLNIMY